MPGRKGWQSEAVAKAVHEVLTLGVSQTEAARHYGCHQSAVSMALREMGQSPPHSPRKEKIIDPEYATDHVNPDDDPPDDPRVSI